MDFVMVGVFGLWGKDGSGGAAEIDSGGFWRFCGVRSIGCTFRLRSSISLRQLG